MGGGSPYIHYIVCIDEGYKQVSKLVFYAQSAGAVISGRWYKQRKDNNNNKQKQKRKNIKNQFSIYLFFILFLNCIYRGVFVLF